jgi:L-seryl-tRNA(Ser) seleniumtransferase
MATDRFGNPHAPNLPYARGKILATTEDDFRKLQRAWAVIRERGPESVFIFTGLEHSLPMTGEELRFTDDEIAPALYFERLRALALAHFGGSPYRHDVAVFKPHDGRHPGDASDPGAARRPRNRASASYSHPSVGRAVNHVGARFIDTAGLSMFEEAIANEARVALVDLTRLAVTYDLMPVEEILAITRIAHDKGALVYMDDAGGARVGPAGFGQPRMLELGVDIGATGLDKYGTVGPRLGLLAGRTDLVARIRATGFEFGLARQMLYPAVARTSNNTTRRGCEPSSRLPGKSPANCARSSATGCARPPLRCRSPPTTSSKSRCGAAVSKSRRSCPTRPPPRWPCCCCRTTAC